MAVAGQGGGLPPRLGYHFMQQMHSDFLHFDALHTDHPHLEGELSFSPVRAVAPRLIADPAAGFEPPVTFEPITTTWNRFNSQPRVTLDARSVRRASGPTETTIWNQFIPQEEAGDLFQKAQAEGQARYDAQFADGGEKWQPLFHDELWDPRRASGPTAMTWNGLISHAGTSHDGLRIFAVPGIYLSHDIMPDIVSDESDVDDMPDLAPPPGPAVSGV